MTKKLMLLCCACVGALVLKARNAMDAIGAPACCCTSAMNAVCRKAGISEATYYYWRKKYAGLTPSEMKRLRQLEEENGKLKKIVADLSLDKAMLQDVIRRKL